MKKIAIAVVMVLTVVGCVRLEVKPGSVVADTVDAGKDLYRTIRMKNNGEEEREYTHALRVNSSESEAELANRCFRSIEQLIDHSGYRIKQTLSQRTENVESPEGAVMHCSTVVVVKPRR